MNAKQVNEMKKLPIITFVACLLFSAYFGWKIKEHTDRYAAAQSEAELLAAAIVETQREAELLKEQALMAAAVAKRAENEAARTLAALE